MEKLKRACAFALLAGWALTSAGQSLSVQAAEPEYRFRGNGFLVSRQQPEEAQGVRWEPEFRFPGTFFPGFAIAAAGRDAAGPVDTAQLYGFRSSSLGVKVFGAPPNASLKVQVEIPEIGVSGEIQASGPPVGGFRFLFPRLSWSQTRLASITQPLTTDAVFRVYLDGALVGEQRRPIRVRAINDAPLVACNSSSCADYSPYMAAFVNENSPLIDGVLRSALDIPAMPVKQWTGTQGNDEQVLMQVWALWYLLQRNKVTYSNITTVSDARADLSSQAVRPLSQTLRTQQANCIDGTALFASILRKIGIEPIIVLVPGHAFLGFYMDAQHSKRAFLETTMLNDANNPFNQRGPSPQGIGLARMLGADVHMKKSWQSFVEALKAGQQSFDRAAPNFGKSGYTLIPIGKARQDGILPLPL